MALIATLLVPGFPGLTTAHATFTTAATVTPTVLVPVVGTVRTSAGEPVAGARIEIEGSATVAATDAAGLFHLDAPPGRATIRVEHPRHEPATLQLEVTPGRDPLAIMLRPLPRFGSEVAVAAVRAGTRAPVTVTDLDREAIADTNLGQELPFVLERKVPSLTLYSDTGLESGYSYIFLRGIQQTRMNLTLDGVPLNEPEDSTLYFVNLADLASALESIQVQRGVGTSAPGAASFVGSINFESIELDQEPRIGGRLVGGSFDTSRVAVAAHSGSFGPGLRFYGRVASQDTEGYRDHSGVSQQSVFVGLTRSGQKSHFKLFGFAGREETELAFLATDEDTLATDPRFNPLATEERDDFGQRFLQAQWHLALGADTDIALQGYYSGADGWYRLWADPAARETLLEYGLDWRNIGLTATLQHRRGDLALTWGAHLADFESTHQQDTVGGAENYRNHGFKNEASSFLKLGWDRGRWHHFADLQLRQARFRFEGDVAIEPKTWTFFNPRLGTRYELSSATSLRASLGTARREPTRSDLFSGEDNPSQPYDTSAVEPERVVDLELGLDWRRPDLELSLDAYAMEFRDEIALTGELSEIGLPVRRNVDQSYRRGIELALGWRPESTLRLDGTASVNVARIQSWEQFYDVYDADGAWAGTTSVTHHDVRPLLSPTVVASLAVEWTPRRALALGLGGRYVGESPLDNTGDDRFRAPDFFDLGASLRIGLEHWAPSAAPRLRLSVTNLLDSRQYPSGYSYRYFTADAAGALASGGIRYFYPTASRAVFVALELGR